MHFLANERIKFNKKTIDSNTRIDLACDCNVFSSENLFKIYYNTILRIESEIGFIVVNNMKIKNHLEEFCARIIEFLYFFPFSDTENEQFYENNHEKISEMIMFYYKKNIKEMNLFIRYRNFNFKKVTNWKSRTKIENLKLLKRFMSVKYNYTQKNTYLKTLKDFQKYTEIYFFLRCYYKKKEDTEKIEQLNIFKNFFYTILKKGCDNEKWDFYVAIDFSQNDLIIYTQLENSQSQSVNLLYEQNDLFQDVSNYYDAIIFNPFCTLFIWKNDFDFVFDDQKYYLRVHTLIQQYIFEIQKKIHTSNFNFENFLINIFEKLINIVFPNLWDKFEILKTVTIKSENILIKTRMYQKKEKI
ncbi:hypothetical protein GVAV_000575 [Gurleya vavrai]